MAPEADERLSWVGMGVPRKHSSCDNQQSACSWRLSHMACSIGVSFTPATDKGSVALLTRSRPQSGSMEPIYDLMPGAMGSFPGLPPAGLIGRSRPI
jgi:hypothetical protein